MKKSSCLVLAIVMVMAVITSPTDAKSLLTMFNTYFGVPIYDTETYAGTFDTNTGEYSDWLLTWKWNWSGGAWLQYAPTNALYAVLFPKEGNAYLSELSTSLHLYHPGTQITGPVPVFCTGNPDKQFYGYWTDEFDSTIRIYSFDVQTATVVSLLNFTYGESGSALSIVDIRGLNDPSNNRCLFQLQYQPPEQANSAPITQVWEYDGTHNKLNLVYSHNSTVIFCGMHYDVNNEWLLALQAYTPTAGLDVENSCYNGTGQVQKFSAVTIDIKNNSTQEIWSWTGIESGCQAMFYDHTATELYVAIDQVNVTVVNIPQKSIARKFNLGYAGTGSPDFFVLLD